MSDFEPLANNGRWREAIRTRQGTTTFTTTFAKRRFAFCVVWFSIETEKESCPWKPGAD